ncbi:acetylhydrolase [Pseudoroseomonas deserti]|uniref:Acetylhydrolase n=1 Tax=Teichococcus deserti TaxID=1817963 RepID=A0A1V2H5K4_9PROT|nr:acetylhydrolase [Pseudoroseomonas deserti]ONG56314.1 acetylhydrolase [Pseudoroseomonas deserti]
MLTRRATLVAPLALPFLALPAAAAPPRILREEWRDAARDRRLPVLLRLPDTPGPAPLMIVSHGLGGSREGLAYLGQALAEAGILTVHLQHPGTDDSLWRGVPDRRANLLAAASDANRALDRLLDVRFALDSLAAAPSLKGRVDTGRIGIGGHSYGAWLVQHMLGQRLPGGDRGLALPDPRLSAGIALSPMPPEGLPPRLAFARVTAPLLHVTGSQDHSWLGGTSAEARRIPYDATSGPAALAVLQGATHAAFAGETGVGGSWEDATYHPRSAGLAVAFLRSLWLGDAASGAFLRAGAPGLLAAGDRLETRGLG